MCTNGFPMGAGYTPLTEAGAATVQPCSVNAVVAADTGGETATANIVGVMPHFLSVLGDGTDPEEYVAPIYTPHIY